MVRRDGEEVEEGGAAVELGQKVGGVALRVGVWDPLKARPYDAVFATPLAKDTAAIAARSHFQTLHTERERNRDREREKWL